MSDTPKRGKSPGYDFWSRRPGAERGNGGFGRIAKWITHRRERAARRRLLLGFDGHDVDESQAPTHEPIGGQGCR